MKKNEYRFGSLLRPQEPTNLKTKTKKAFQDFLNLSLNQYRCPDCFSTLDVQVHFGASSYLRYKGSDYLAQIISDFKEENTIRLSLNMKLCCDGRLIKKPYSRMRGKIFDYNRDVQNKRRFIDSAVKPFLICKKCKYSKQLSCFVKKPSGQYIKKIL